MSERPTIVLLVIAFWLAGSYAWGRVHRRYGSALSALGQTFAPPHGHWVLLGAWAVAGMIFYLGTRVAGSSPLLGTGLELAAGVAVLVAGRMCYDRRRIAQGRPAFRDEPLPDVAGWVARLLLGGCAVVGAATLVATLRGGVSPARDLVNVLTVLALTLWSAGVAATGRWAIVRGAPRPAASAEPPRNPAAT